MNNDLEQFSEERLKELLAVAETVHTSVELFNVKEMIPILRIALAAKQAKPVGYFVHTLEDGVCGMTSIPDDSPLVKVATPLYSAPQPAHTEQDGWIKCSERMPDVKTAVLVGCFFGRNWTSKWATFVPGSPESQISGWIIPGASWNPTHWMPLPAAPKPESE